MYLWYLLIDVHGVHMHRKFMCMQRICYLVNWCALIIWIVYYHYIYIYTDIDECHLRTKSAIYEKLYPCDSSSRCEDTDGGYKCICRFPRRGDGTSDEGCKPILGARIVATLGKPIDRWFLINYYYDSLYVHEFWPYVHEFGVLNLHTDDLSSVFQ